MSKSYSDKQKAAYYKKKANRIVRSSVYAPRISGRGAYRIRPRSAVKVGAPKRRRAPGLFSTLGGLGGSALGTALGGPAGTALGGLVGRQAGDILARITGFGDYQVGVNTLTNPENMVPEFANNGPRTTCIRHKEFIQDIQSSATITNGATAFDITTFRIQPADSQTFPWLSLIASNYEQYQIRGMVFEFKTTSGVLATTPALGTVVMATQYNSLTPAFTNKQEMENYEFAGSTVPSASLIHPIECDPKQTQCNGIFNIASNSNNLGGDIRLYDMGRFNIATVGLPVASEVCGELWVSYDICLLKPRLNPDSGSVADHYVNATGVAIAFPSYFGTFGTNLIRTANSDNFTSIVAGGNAITFNKTFYGSVAVTYDVVTSTSSSSQSDPTITGTNGATPLDIQDGGNIQGKSYLITNDVIQTTSFWVIQPLSNGTLPTLTWTSGSLGGATPSNMDLFIMQLPSDFS